MHRLTSAGGMAKQVCWERLDGYHLASSHMGNFMLWDVRFSKQALKTTHAHKASILGLDFSMTRRGDLVSSCNDKEIKFWDTNNDDMRPRHELTSRGSSVWKIR